MQKQAQLVSFLLAAIFGVPFALAAAKNKAIPSEQPGEITGSVLTVLWREPAKISSENLFYGAGGRQHEPRGPFTFLREDLDGSNPKFDVRDEHGVQWKVKLGDEARPETVATRLLWSVGYHTDWDYFLPSIRVEELPSRLHRGRDRVGPRGTIQNVRLKREPQGEQKIAIWKWRRDPFAGTREWNGLRVMMAVINNWDLKDENNAVHVEKRPAAGEARIYEISDLGASFGKNGLSLDRKISKGDLEFYIRSKFIKKIGPDYVNFATPRRADVITLFNPHEFFSRLNLRWIGKQVPRQDARWMGGLLAQLSPRQIRDAFRAGGYSPREVDGFATVVEARIAQLDKL